MNLFKYQGSIIKILIIFSIQEYDTKILQPVPVSPILKYLSDCIVNVVDKYFTRDLPIAVLVPRNTASIPPNNDNILGDYLINTLNKRIMNTFLILNQDNNARIMNNWMKPGSYILLISGENNLFFNMAYHMLRTIFETTKTYASARVLVAITDIPRNQTQQVDTAREILEMIWKGLIIYDSAAIVPNPVSELPTKRDFDGFGVFNWNPLKQRNSCLKYLSHIEYVDNWQSNIFIKNANLYPQTDLTNMHGCKLNIRMQEHVPYAFQLIPGIIWGVFPIAIEILKSKLNFKVSYTFEATDIRPELLFPVTYTSGNVSTHEECLMTYPHTQENIKWFVPAGAPIPRWKSLTKIFNPFLWFSVMVLYIAGSITAWVLLESTQKEKQPKAFSVVLMDTLLTYLAMGISDKYKGTLSTAFFVIWLFYCLIINTAYQSALISFLADPGEYPPIRSNQELHDSDLELVSRLDFLGILDTDLLYLKHYQHRYTYEELLQRISKKNNVAFLTNEVDGTMILLKSFSSETNKPRMTPIHENVHRVYVSMYVNTFGCLLFDRIETLMNRLMSGGIFDNFLEKLHTGVFIKFSELENDDVFRLTLSHLQGSFYLLCVGLSMSCVTIVTEIMLSVFIK
ncbi:Ionotropic receptor 433 [Blattella germanica]|nr:Ionotropic receptor 433 [Blattella germanica]